MPTVPEDMTPTAPQALAPSHSAQPAPGGFWSFDRGIAIANFAILLSGALWVGIDWYPKHRQLEISLLADQQSPLEGRGDLSVVLLRRFPDGSKLLSIKHPVRFKNISKVSVPIVSYTSQLFLGQLNEVNLEPMAAISINPPPRPLGYESSSSPITWKEAARRSQAIFGPTGDRAKGLLSRRGLEGVFDRFETLGSIFAGGSTAFDHQFIVRVKKDAYIGLVDTISISSPLDGGHVHYYTTYECEQPDRMANVHDKRFTEIPSEQTHAGL